MNTQPFLDRTFGEDIEWIKNMTRKIFWRKRNGDIRIKVRSDTNWFIGDVYVYAFEWRLTCKSEDREVSPFGPELYRLIDTHTPPGHLSDLRQSMINDLASQVDVLIRHSALKAPDSLILRDEWIGRIDTFREIVQRAGLDSLPHEPNQRLDELLAAYQNADRCEWATPPPDLRHSNDPDYELLVAR